MTRAIKYRSSDEPIRGEIVEGYESETESWKRVLQNPRELLASNGTTEILVHGQRPASPLSTLQKQERSRKQELIHAGKAKRFVLSFRTPSGPKIFKLLEPQSTGNHIQGIFHSSTARIEHRNQLRCQTLKLAAAQSLGFLELRRGPLLVRACQIQEPVPLQQLTLFEAFFTQELARSPKDAISALATAIAQMHLKGFFHNDLKGFHAFARITGYNPSGTAHYDLLWIDLARVGFKLTKRQRIINLYQVFRYILPANSEAQATFTQIYCEVSGWHKDNYPKALRQVSQFLDFKLRTHPSP